MSKIRRAGYVCVRSSFGILNGLLWALGCVIVGAAIWLRIEYQGYVSLLPQHDLLSLDAVLLFFGLLIVVVAFFGCCGAWCKNRCLLISYFTLVVILGLAVLTLGILGYEFGEDVSTSLQEELLYGIRNNYNASSDSGITLAWDHIQNQFNCCGVKNYEDWFNITAWPNETRVPHSCCISSFKHMAECGEIEEISMWNPHGCYGQMEKWFEERLHFVAVIGFSIGFIQLFGLIASMILFCAARRRAGYKTYKAEKSPALL